jgi:hypothetical protein
MADKPLHFYDPLEYWDRMERDRAQEAVESIARDFAHQLRGRGQHHLVDELRARCLEHGFPVHI